MVIGVLHLLQFPVTIFSKIIDPFLGPAACGYLKSLRECVQLSAVNHLIAISFER